MIIQLILRAICSLPDWLLVLVTGGETIVNGEKMDGPSQFFNFLATRRNLFGGNLPPQSVRRKMERSSSMIRPPLEVTETEDHLISVEGGTISVRVFRPDNPNGAALVYYHGGGWVVGSVDGNAYPVSCLAQRSDVTVISVNYRLAPEHPYPTPVDDCYAALCWVVEHADELGVDASRVAVGGDSAGGNLTAAVTLRSRERAGPKISYQLLIYPAVDLADEWPSMQRYADGYLLGRGGMRWFKDHYVSAERRREQECSPLHAATLKGLPRAYVLLAGFDPLRDEGWAYAQRLEEAGVNVTVDEVQSSIHGFFNMGKYVPVADAAVTRSAQALRSALSA